MKRVVADSNVLVSALQFGGKPMALLTLAEEGQIDLAISEAILTETLGVLRVKFQNTEEQLADREAYLRAISRLVTPSEAVAVIQADRPTTDGAWLDLRDSDNTYALSPYGLHLLSVLHAADFDNLAPANALARAAQNAAFGATLEGASSDAAGYLLDQLLELLDDQVEQARVVLQQGRPYRMIDWSRREHRRQLETIQQVLNMLQERLDASSHAFHQVVRLHDAMQEIVRVHTGIHNRLREWNLDRLYTAEAGYSVPELLEAILGAEDMVCGRR